MGTFPSQTPDESRHPPAAAVFDGERLAGGDFSALLAELVRSCHLRPNTDLNQALESIARALRRLASPEQPLGIEEVAEFCRCTVDTIRRTPVEQLPRYRYGREDLFLKHEILQFIVTYRRVQPADSRLDQPHHRRPKSSLDGGRGRDSRKGKAS